VTWPLAVLAAEPPRWMLIACVVAATLTLPGGYNWAEATRLPGSLLMTAALVVLAFRAGRQRMLRDRRGHNVVR
jgi:hypothetical protein